MKGYDLIYGLYCPVTMRIVYIGQTSRGRVRFSEHFAPCNKIKNKKIAEYFKDYKAMFIEIESVEFRKDMDEKESFWIEYFKNRGQCHLNEFIGKKHSDRTKKLVSKSNHKRGCKEETKKRIGISNSKYIFTYNNKKILGIKTISKITNIPISSLHYKISNGIKIPKVTWEKM